MSRPRSVGVIAVTPVETRARLNARLISREPALLYAVVASVTKSRQGERSRWHGAVGDGVDYSNSESRALADLEALLVTHAAPATLRSAVLSASDSEFQ